MPEAELEHAQVLLCPARVAAFEPCPPLSQAVAAREHLHISPFWWAAVSMSLGSNQYTDTVRTDDRSCLQGLTAAVAAGTHSL